MSHFSVMVISDDYETLLAPFDENIEMDRYVQYTKEELIAKERKSIQNTKENCYDKWLADKEGYEKDCTNPRHLIMLEEEFPLRLKWTDEECYKSAIEWYEPDQIGEEGEVYSTYNPDSQWDWYQLGGRWSGLLKLKDGAEGVTGSTGLMDSHANKGAQWVDQAKFKDIDWERMKDNPSYIKSAKKEWKDAEEGKGLYKLEYYKERYGTLENFIAERCAFGTWAVVTEDGEWLEKGEMGWWGLSSETHEEAKKWSDGFYETFLKDRKPDDVISIIDCHI